MVAVLLSPAWLVKVLLLLQLALCSVQVVQLDIFVVDRLFSIAALVTEDTDDTQETATPPKLDDCPPPTGETATRTQHPPRHVMVNKGGGADLSYKPNWPLGH